MKPKTKTGQSLTPKDKKPQAQETDTPPAGELTDHVSSTDEEGYDVPDNPYEQDLLADQLNANVTRDERKSLDDAANKKPTTDQQALERAELDQEDEEGEPLNVSSGLSGGDLDVPGSELDDDNEEIGEEDEENNSFSLDDETQENDNTRQ
jgi:hypothetical protein